MPWIPRTRADVGARGAQKYAPCVPGISPRPRWRSGMARGNPGLAQGTMSGADAPLRARTARGFRSVHPCAAGAWSTLPWRWLRDGSRSRRRCTTPSDVAGPLAVAKKADTRRRRRSRITSYVHHRRSRCSARGPTTATSAPPSLRLRLRLECARARGHKRPPASRKLRLDWTT